MGECEPRNFLQPCLLLLLCERSDHGYDLVDRLRVLHAADGDAGAVYRALRGLEKSGLVRSTWEASDAGPARRTYQVTPLGIATLDRQAELLEETHQTLHLFRERHRQLFGMVEGGHRPTLGYAGRPGARSAVAVNGATRDGAGVAVNGAVRNGAGVAGSGAARNGASSTEAAALMSTGADANDGRRRNGNGRAGGTDGDPGGRGVRAPRPPSQRTGS